GLFSEEDLKILELISSQAGVSIENAILYKQAIVQERIQQDLEIASEIQHLFLPKSIEKIKKVSIDTVYSPAEFIGGDYYDVIKIDNNRYGIIIMDISGHGSSAAIVMSVISFVVHSVMRRIKDTAQLMNHLNESIFSRLHGEKYATGIFMIYDTVKEIFEYTNAGHSNILLYSKKFNKIGELAKRGMPIGINKDTVYTKERFKFSKGDILLLETDGLYETKNANEKMFSMERVKKLLFNYRDKAVDEINRYIIADLNKFRGTLEQDDDITLISLKKIE
ncbi:MAG: PP2C family protein-serine/threonine phosphatase, partial [Spirochaetes bacterium]|nr:PP2C family protein-serine/threonine phosphatase [Spirochaetota bacterium]